jgi:hypothetical protein
MDRAYPELQPARWLGLPGLHAQPKQGAAPVFRRMLASHERALATAQQRGEPAAQIAARQLEVSRISHALRRAEDLTSDVAAAIEGETVSR